MDTEIEVPAAVVNMDLVNKVLDTIEQDLTHWGQSQWTTDADRKTLSFCDTSFCFGGWALKLMNRLRVGDSGYIWPVDEAGERSGFGTEAAKVLGFNDALAHAVFYNMETDFTAFKAQVLADIERIGPWTQSQVQNWLED